MEVMVSVLDDRELGAVAYVRPGGILTELIPGSTIIWHGWAPARRRERLAESLVGRLLTGYRGGHVYDLAALSDLIDALLVSVAAGTVDFVELNPVIVLEDGVVLVDALARLSTVTET